MDGDTGNLFNAYIEGNGNAKEHLVNNKLKKHGEKRHKDFSCIAKEDTNVYNTDIIYVSPKFQVKSEVKISGKIAKAQKKRTRKNSVDLKFLQNKLSAYNVISKSILRQKFPSLSHTSDLNIRELCSGLLCSKPNNEVKVLYERETAKRGRKNNTQLKDSESKAAKKSQSSDLFGFHRCMQRKRNVHYNLNVIYKFLRKDRRLKDDNVLRCKHYSFEDINQNQCKKMSSAAKIASDIPAHYNIVDFAQCSSVSNVYLLKPKDNKNRGPRMKTFTPKPSTKVNKRRCIVNKSDSHDSVNTQTLSVKSKQKKVSTCTCRTSKFFSWRNVADNICQPSQLFCKHLTKPLEFKSNMSDEQKKSHVPSPAPLNIFKAAIKYFLCTIAVIVWLPCILVMGLLWLISYPLRPHQDSKCTENITKKNKSNKVKKNKRNKLNTKANKRKQEGKDSLSTIKLQTKSLKLSRKKISPIAKRKHSKTHEKLSNKPTGDTKKSLPKIDENKEALSKSNTGFRFSDRTTNVKVFPSEVSRPTLDKKKQKNVTFKQPIENAYDKTISKKAPRKLCMCREPIPSKSLEDDKCKKELKDTKKRLRSYKIDPSESQKLKLKKHQLSKSKTRKVKPCFRNPLSKLLQIVFRHTYFTTSEIRNFHTSPKIKNYNTDKVSGSLDNKKKRSRRSKCKPHCCKKDCSDSILPKSCKRNVVFSKSSTIHKEIAKRNKVAIKKSDSVNKFLSSPRQQIQQPSPVAKYSPKPIQRTKSNTKSVNEGPKKSMPKVKVAGDAKAIRQTTTEMKSDTQIRDKKGSKTRPTTVVKFFPPPTSTKDQCETDRTGGSLTKSSSKSKALAIRRLPPHTTSTNTDPAKTSSPHKFLSEPRKKSQTVSTNTSKIKTSSDNNFVKSSRRNTTSKGSATNPHTTTSIIKFLPAPCPQTCSGSSNTYVQKSTSTFSEPSKTTTVVKFFPPPQQRQINTAVNTAESKSSPLKNFLNGFRCSARTRSIGSNARIEKRTSVFKYLPPPKHDTRTLAVNAVRTPSVLSNVSTQCRQEYKTSGNKIQLKSTSKKTLLKVHENNRNTTSKNVHKTPKNATTTPSLLLSKKRSRGVTAQRSSQIVKFFPKQRRNTRSLAVGARPSGKSKERILTANKPTSSPKGTYSVMNFFPYPRVMAGTIGTNTFLRTLNKKSGASKLTNMIKFYPTPKKATINRGTVPRKLKNKSFANLQKLSPRTTNLRVQDKNNAQPSFMRGFRKLTERPVVRKLGHPPKASSASKRTSNATTLVGGKIKQKSRLVQSPCQPDCKGVQANRKSYYDKKFHIAFTKGHQVRKSSDRPRTDANVKAPQRKSTDPRVQRYSYGSKYSKFIPASGITKSRESDKPPPGKIKRFLARIYNYEVIECADLFTKSSDRPCRWIYERWPSAYPAFMVLYKIYNNMIHIFFFFFAACLWCPLFCWCFIFYFFVVKRLFC